MVETRCREKLEMKRVERKTLLESSANIEKLNLKPILE